MYPKEGGTEVAKWSGNTEATARKHYIVDVRPEEGAAWFAAVDQSLKQGHPICPGTLEPSSFGRLFAL